MRKRKAFYLIIFSLLVLFLLPSCKNEKSEKKEIILFAASSLEEPIIDIVRTYEETNQDVNIICNFDSSGTLRTQINEGGYCDIFISAGRNQMDDIDQSLIIERKDYLKNSIVLVVPSANPKNIQSFSDLMQRITSEKILLSIGNKDVPVGQYSEQIFQYYQVPMDELNKTSNLSYASSAKEVLTQVKEASVDCGILYKTDAVNSDLTIVDEVTDEMNLQVIYPIGLLSYSDSSDSSDVKEFFDYLNSESAFNVMQRFGFMGASKE